MSNFSFNFNPRLQKIRSQLLNNPYYRLQSWEEIAIASELGIKIDVNQATVDDWLRLPGLSIRQARSLVELSRNGIKFFCIEDIAAALSISTHLLKPLEPILSFTYYDEESLTLPPQLINPNNTTVSVLAQVPFIDAELAQAIVENRQTLGQFRSLVDFQQRLGLSTDVISQLMYYLRF
jgi:DNA uptake protein ComE-like DNA-binding protein